MSPDVLFIPAVVAIIHAAITWPAVSAGNRNEFVLIIAVKGGDGIDTYHFSRGRSLNDVYTIAMGVAVAAFATEPAESGIERKQEREGTR